VSIGKNLWMGLLLSSLRFCWAAGVAYEGSLPSGSALLFSVHAGDAANCVVLCDLHGNELWKNRDALAHPQMVQVLDDASVLCATQDGAHILDGSGASIWRYRVPDHTQNCIALPLGENRFLVGHEGPGKLLEIDSGFKILHEIKLDRIPRKNHGQFRFCSITPQGTYLVPVTFENRLREYDRDGNILSEVADLPQVTQAQRLDNGHTWVSLRGQLREYDKNGKVVWQFDLKKDGALPVCPVTSFCQLPDQHFLLTLYQAGAAPDLIEINRDKKIIHRWTFPRYSKIAYLAIVASGHPLLESAK